MNITEGRTLTGPAGTATEVVTSGEPPRPDWQATLAVWFLDCPDQSPAWRHYLLSIIHLRPIDGVPPAVIRVPHATHEILLLALNPDANPVATDSETWRFLMPVNAEEQMQPPDDDSARHVAEQAAWAVIHGHLPAEPPLAGAVEPWRTSMIKTAAHARGEEHAR